ncbi:cupin domain-containing protein [Alteromonas sp. KUL49]|uniref:cupin domain-containing protein n=1 Tax=Alteromonas sp. KUL49 TaxID=2480798 RepID=UPI00102F1DF2|nr:cupin domain-containing protein [Alteromonas sp. KUL49]TAP38945.1 cupin [Alteromonas sp. KUL49]GEA12385.1 hypothetical protein KUL49_27600 [Alteromonas sp. KUL49]
MRYNADFNEAVIIKPDDYEWRQSPMIGVERMFLDRIGDEVARATSIVRYAPNSEFPSHQHDGGEEILVLDGVFADEHGEYPSGYYLRNPIGTAHRPRVGASGALLFVKLHQFAKDDTLQLAVNTNGAKWRFLADGLSNMLLHSYESECVDLLRFSELTTLAQQAFVGGVEYFVMEGGITVNDEFCTKGSWIRLPHNFTHSLRSEEETATLLRKRGHLNTDVKAINSSWA